MPILAKPRDTDSYNRITAFLQTEECPYTIATDMMSLLSLNVSAAVAATKVVAEAQNAVSVPAENRQRVTEDRAEQDNSDTDSGSEDSFLDLEHNNTSGISIPGTLLKNGEVDSISKNGTPSLRQEPKRDEMTGQGNHSSNTVEVEQTRESEAPKQQLEQDPIETSVMREANLTPGPAPRKSRDLRVTTPQEKAQNAHVPVPAVPLARDRPAPPVNPAPQQSIQQPMPIMNANPKQGNESYKHISALSKTYIDQYLALTPQLQVPQITGNAFQEQPPLEALPDPQVSHGNPQLTSPQEEAQSQVQAVPVAGGPHQANPEAAPMKLQDSRLTAHQRAAQHPKFANCYDSNGRLIIKRKMKDIHTVPAAQHPNFATYYDTNGRLIVKRQQTNTPSSSSSPPDAKRQKVDHIPQVVVLENSKLSEELVEVPDNENRPKMSMSRLWEIMLGVQREAQGEPADQRNTSEQVQDSAIGE